MDGDATTLDLTKASTKGVEVAVPELTHRLAQGDEEAYRIFFALYYERLLRYLNTVLQGDEPRAREALQSTLLRVVKHVRRFPDEAVFWSWLSLLARSAAFDDLRRRKRYGSFLARYTRECEVQPVDSLPDGQHDTESLKSALEEAVAQLAPAEKHILFLKYRRGQTVHAIAAELGESEKAVESRLVRIRRGLKEAILRLLKHERSR